MWRLIISAAENFSLLHGLVNSCTYDGNGIDLRFDYVNKLCVTASLAWPLSSPLPLSRLSSFWHPSRPGVLFLGAVFRFKCALFLFSFTFFIKILETFQNIFLPFVKSSDNNLLFALDSVQTIQNTLIK